jgi:urease accessory protein UreF
MVLTDEDIAKFQTLYKEQFGKEISREDAYESGIKLLRLLSHVYQPMTKDEFETVQKHRVATLPLLQERINKP